MENLVDNLLLGIEPRGKDATGICSIMSDGDFQLYKKDVSASEFINCRPKLPKRPQTIMLHTRYATQGHQSWNRNNHPIVYNDIVVTHNGHIINDDDIFWEEDLKRMAKVDSEAIAALFHKYTIDKAHIPLQKLDGNLAVAVADTNTPRKLVLAKGVGSPLFVWKAKEGVLWASTQIAIQDACKKALGFWPSYSEIEMASDGDIFFIEDGSVEKLVFEPLKPKYRWKAWHRDNQIKNNQPISNRKKYTKKEKERQFTTNINGKEVTYYECDNCEHFYGESSTYHIGNFNFCETCWHSVDESEEEAETIDDVAETAENIAQLSWIELDDNDDRDIICKLLAEKYDTSPHYVKWILFEAEDSDFDDNSYLISVYTDLKDEFDNLAKDLGVEDPEIGL